MKIVPRILVLITLTNCNDILCKIPLQKLDKSQNPSQIFVINLLNSQTVGFVLKKNQESFDEHEESL